MDFNRPLIGTREANYKFFYCTGGAVMISLALLMLITGYTAFVSSHVGSVMSSITEVLTDVKTILPEAREALKLLEGLCHNANFTRTYGNLCGL